MKKKLRIVKRLVSVLLLLLSGFVFAAYLYISRNFPDVSFEQLMYSLFYVKGTSFNAISEGLLHGGFIILVFSIIVLFPFYVRVKNKYYFCYSIHGIEHKVRVVPLSIDQALLYFLTLFFLCLWFSADKLGGISYVANQLDKSSIFEDYYVDPRSVDISFPEDKKNLVYIFVESLEMTNASFNNGGGLFTSYIPNLERLALDNTNFSNDGNLGGALQVDGVGWTVAGMVAQTAATPLKLRIQGNTYTEYSSFLPGAYSIGEVLKNNGYNNYIMMGSDADYAGRKQYFVEHGDYQIYDYYWAITNELIDKDYNEWWGFEDSKLFEFAKNELLNISSSDQLFNFTLLTADTHFPDGFLDKSCEDDLKFDTHYANSFYCNDKMVYDFVEWIKKQDFYKDTVVVVVGDHLTMQGDFYSDLNSDFDRVVYNAFLNTGLSSNNTKNRLFTTMDMYPTTLAALGASISGDRIGLGTNLFSGRKTVLEILGFDKMDGEIGKNSDYYNKNLLGNTYKEMYRNIEKGSET